MCGVVWSRYPISKEELSKIVFFHQVIELGRGLEMKLLAVLEKSGTLLGVALL